MDRGCKMCREDRFPPREAIRGPARPSIAFDPSERLKPTLLGHSASYSERLFLPQSGRSRRAATIVSGLSAEVRILVGDLLHERDARVNAGARERALIFREESWQAPVGVCRLW
jgi:hypothetical protein